MDEMDDELISSGASKSEDFEDENAELEEPSPNAVLNNDGSRLSLPARKRRRETALNSPFLESNWNRVGSVQFRNCATMPPGVRKKLSNLSDLRSNSVFEEVRSPLDEVCSTNEWSEQRDEV